MADEPQGGVAPQPEPAQPVQAPAPAPASQPAPQQAPVAPAPAPAAPSIPASAPDRTKEQFEKLLESNKRLYEANELLRQEMVKRNQSNQTFAPIQQPVQQTPQGPAVQQTPVRQPDPKDFIETDPVTGERFINEQRLQAAFEDLRREASSANQAVQQYIQTAEQRESERQNREAFASYPELNPNAQTFNYGFHQQVRGILYDSMINSHEYGGKPLSFKEAADFVKAQYPTTSPAPVAAPAPADTAAQTQAQQTLKEQASSGATGQPAIQQRQSYADDTELRDLQFKTRMGSDEALAARLKHTPHILPPDAGVE